MAHAFDHRNASLSEGFFSLLWSEPCLESLIGSGLARIPRVGCDNRGGASPGVPPPRTVRRAWRGRTWRERPRHIWRWCATGQGEVVHAKIHHLPSPFGVAPSTEIPGGKAIERCSLSRFGGGAVDGLRGRLFRQLNGRLPTGMGIAVSRRGIEIALISLWTSGGRRPG